MSHAQGAVKFPDGKIMFFEYNGTVDICLPHLYETKEQLTDNWRRKDWITCTCGNGNDFTNHVRVRIATTYGYGYSWDGFACKECKCLLSPLDVNYDTETSGLPDWYPGREHYEWENEQVIKDKE